MKRLTEKKAAVVCREVEISGKIYRKNRYKVKGNNDINSPPGGDGEFYAFARVSNGGKVTGCIRKSSVCGVDKNRIYLASLKFQSP